MTSPTRASLRILGPILFGAWLSLTLGVPGVKAAVVTFGISASSPYSYTVAGAPVSAVTITLGDSIAFANVFPTNDGARMVQGCNAVTYLYFNSSAVTLTFQVPATYTFNDSFYGGCALPTYFCPCGGMQVSVIVQPPSMVTSPPCVWTLNSPVWLVSGTYNLCSLDIQPGGILYVDRSVTLNVSGGVTVETGGMVVGTGLGYVGQGWTGTPGPGTGSQSQSGSGGGHAGPGGTGMYEQDPYNYYIQGGASYDSAAAPSLPGSGGGIGSGAIGGNGGAALVIQDLTGTVRLDGTLQFDGLPGASLNFGNSSDATNGGGGGAGGSLYVQALNLSGAGILSASGGAGGNGMGDYDYDNLPGGGGSGGLITFCVLNSDTFSGTVSVNAGGGTAGAGIFSHSSFCNPTATFVTFTPTPTYTPTPCGQFLAPPCPPTETPTPTNTNSSTPTGTPTSTATLTPTSSATPSPTPSPTCTPSRTATPTASWSPTSTPTLTWTSTPTLTWSPTSTPTFTASPTDTPPCVTHLWPNPYNPAKAVAGKLKVGCIPLGSEVRIYTLSGELVRQIPEEGQLAEWDGVNRVGAPSASGIYFYVVLSGNRPIERGKFLLIR